MMYPFLTLDDQTELEPDEKDCFHHATCHLPAYKWTDIYGFTDGELEKLNK